MAKRKRTNRETAIYNKTLHRNKRSIYMNSTINQGTIQVFRKGKQFLLSTYHITLITNPVIGHKWGKKSNNKITEHRAIFRRERQNSYVNKQTKSVNNRKTGPDWDYCKRNMCQLAATLYQENHDRNQKLLNIGPTKRYIPHMQVLLECYYM